MTSHTKFDSLFSGLTAQFVDSLVPNPDPMHEHETAPIYVYLGMHEYVGRLDALCADCFGPSCVSGDYQVLEGARQWRETSRPLPSRLPAV